MASFVIVTSPVIHVPFTIHRTVLWRSFIPSTTIPENLLPPTSTLANVKMSPFVQCEIYGTRFEITRRFVLSLVSLSNRWFMSIFKVSRFTTGRSRRVRYGLVCLSPPCWNRLHSSSQLTPISSAKDQSAGKRVAIKKITVPFSTQVLSKRTYRELKLLRHLRHENVSLETNILLCED